MARLDEAASTLLTERVELLMDECMRDWAKVAASHDQRSVSGWIRRLISAELTSKYGPGWMQDHPGGDQG